MRKLALVVAAGIVVAVGAWWLWHSAAPIELPQRRGANDGAATNGAPAAAAATAPDEVSGRATAPAAEAQRQAEATTLDDATPRWHLTGRVLDDHRRPADRAAITLFGRDGRCGSATSDASGQFSFEIARPPTSGSNDPANRVGVVASASDHRVARTIVWLGERPWEIARPGAENEIDAGTLVLVQGAIVRLFVHDDSGPVAGARVYDRAEWASVEFPLGRSGADGRVELRDVVPGMVDLRVDGSEHGTGARSLRCDSGVAVDVDVALVARQAVDFEVVEMAGGAPIGGAKLRFTEPFVHSSMNGDFSSGGGAHGEQQRDDLAATCDESGRAHLLLDAVHRLRVQATADGWSPPPRSDERPGTTSDRAAIEPETTTVRLQLRRLDPRVVRWPVKDGEVPAPADGTALTARASSMFDLELGVPSVTGRIVEGQIELTGVPRDGWNGLVATPDDDLARLSIDGTKAIGPAVSFVQGRAARITVLHTDGRPFEGALVQLRDQGNNPVAPGRWSDAAGRVRFDALWPQTADVYVGDAGNTFPDRRIGTVDLMKGDAELECRLTDPARGRLRVVIDGGARLPATYRISAGRARTRDLHEDAEHGEVTFALTVDDAASCDVWLSATGFLPAHATVALAREGEPVATAIELRRGARVTARVHPLSNRGNSIVLERPGDPTSIDRMRLPYEATQAWPNGPESSFEWFPVEPGRWRVRDAKSGLATDEFDLAAGDAHEVELDLSHVVTVKGNVLLPAGVKSDNVRIVLADEPAPEIDTTSSWLQIRSANHFVNQDGSFELAVASGRAIVLHAWHPWLQPAHEGGVVTVTDPTQPVTLKLEPRGLLTFRMKWPTHGRQDMAGSCSVWLLDRGGAAPRKLAAIAEVGGDGNALARCGVDVTGTFDLLIDARNGRAPARVDGVALLAEAATELGDVDFPAGVALRVPITMKNGGDPPRLYVFATMTGPVTVTRWANSQGEAEARLVGLGPGRWEVEIGVVMDDHALQKTTIEVDGVNDAIVPIEIE